MAVAAAKRPAKLKNGASPGEWPVWREPQTECRRWSDFPNVSSWPGPDQHLNRIRPDGTAAGLCKLPLKTSRLQCREWLQALQSGSPNAKTEQVLENGRFGANRELNVGYGVISRTSLPGRVLK